MQTIRLVSRLRGATTRGHKHCPLLFSSCCILVPRNVSTLVTKFEASVNDLPLREAVRFTDKNVKWTAETINVRPYSYHLSYHSSSSDTC
jgi:hypothetical protein